MEDTSSQARPYLFKIGDLEVYPLSDAHKQEVIDLESYQFYNNNLLQQLIRKTLPDRCSTYEQFLTYFTDLIEERIVLEVIDPTDGSLACAIMYEDFNKPCVKPVTSFNHLVSSKACGQVKSDGFKGIDTSKKFIYFQNICTN